MNHPDLSADSRPHRVRLLLVLAVLSIPTAACLVAKSVLLDRLPHDVSSALCQGGEAVFTPRWK